MAQTIVGLNDPKTVKRYSSTFAADMATKSFFGSRMTDTSGDLPVWRKTELEKEKGASVTFSLSMPIGGETVHGDDYSEGTEEALRWFDDIVYIDAEQKGVDAGGKMTQKNILDDTRDRARKTASDYWVRWFDNTCFYQVSGARGVGDSYGKSLTHKLTYTGGPNTLVAPDSDHLVYAGAATSKATLAATDLIDLALIASLRAKAETMGDGDNDVPAIQSIDWEGDDRFVFVMQPYQAKKLKTATGDGTWLDVQKAAATRAGYQADIFRGSMGVYDGVVLQRHRRVVKFSDYGAGGNVKAARALFLGKQALIVAYGSPGGNGKVPFDWFEERYDNGRKFRVSTDTIIGVKKSTYTDSATNTKHDFGVIAVDAALPSS